MRAAVLFLRAEDVEPSVPARGGVRTPGTMLTGTLRPSLIGGLMSSETVTVTRDNQAPNLCACKGPPTRAPFIGLE